ncbi:GDP-mannose 4,6-dehydratase [Candidatus Uhrbacteria bacterium]|nr:GDP-mannose 4,6-dehydratase [Candidatus Uhrbacteria bacterium]
MRKKALITGVTGQDGSYLAEFLLAKGYEVHGTIRRSSTNNAERIEHLVADSHLPTTRFFLHYADLADSNALQRLIQSIRPDEVYNIGAQAHVRVSFDVPEFTGDVTGLGAIRLLEAIRQSGLNCRFYQASSSEMFGDATDLLITEQTPFHPASPYGAAKAFAHHVTVNYREAYGMYACGGILFNHESPRRGETYVTRKITQAIFRIKAGMQQKLYLGNLDAKRDWGYAKEYVEAMWLMLQQDEPDDYIIATGEAHSVREFVNEAFSYAGLDPTRHVAFDARELRPKEIPHLVGDASKARAKLGWQPQTTFRALVRMMVDAEGKSFAHRAMEQALPSIGVRS